MFQANKKTRCYVHTCLINLCSYKYWSICSNAFVRMVCTVSSSSGSDSAQSNGNHGKGKGRARCSSNQLHLLRRFDSARVTCFARYNALHSSMPIARFFSAICCRRLALSRLRYSSYVPSRIILSLQAFCNNKFLRFNSSCFSAGMVW